MKNVRLNSRVSRVLRGRSRGFSLIEVVIAIALIGIIGVAILSALSYASMVLIMNKGRATAESIARTQMEYVKNYKPYDGDGRPDYPLDPSIRLPPGYTLNTTATVLNRDEDPHDDGIQLIKVTVTYYVVTPAPGKRMAPREYTLEDYKRA